MDAARAYQYLKVMGITAWTPRSQADAAAPAESVAHSVAPAQSPAAAVPVAHQMAVSAYLQQLGDTPATPLHGTGGRLLLVIEPPALTAADTELLTKMLAAINLDAGAQELACLSTDGPLTLRELVARQQPEMVLVMVGCGGNAASIDQHRAQHAQPEWCGCRVALSHHPCDLNAQANLKRPAWEDLKRIKAVLDG